ncbi:multimerin-2 isoform X1 [Castor canadensis]|uniref:multimerin-2 isoform X1 n=1 Tax=Castor canadensis TaxID=51338 RepID=UPI003D16A067
MILTLLLGLGGPLGWGLLGAWAQDSGTRFSDPHSPRPPGTWEVEAEDTNRDPTGRNWCPYQKSRLVTFVAACKTEKFLIHSQQPCPQEDPDCQRVKVMYRVAQKPVYQVKQKVLLTVAWRCCPGFKGPNCQNHDPTATFEPSEPGDGLQESWVQLGSYAHGHPAAELSEVEEQQERQKRLLRELQNDQEAGSLPAVTTEVNQTALGFSGRSLEHMLLPHVDTFLQAHFSPIWKSFNESLHSLSQAVRNLSLDVEANRQAIRRVQEDRVARADFQEFGAKFEAKVQENSQRVGQLQQDVQERLHTQHRALNRWLSEVQADVDSKLKQLLNGSLVVGSVGAAARPEPESLQARLGQLQRNLSELHVAASLREEELQSTLENLQATVAQHMEEIKELYSESDETFALISKVEGQVGELQVNHTELRELRVILMEKSLIMEENKEEMERQFLELNLTLQHLQDSQADLIKYVKDCNCQKLSFDLDVIREDQKDTTRALEETQVSLDEQRQLNDSSLQALRIAVDAMSQTVDTHKKEGEVARADRSRLRTKLWALDRDVKTLKAAARDTVREVRGLHSSFAALLEDALRHQAVLAALFGEEVMEEMSQEEPGPLSLSYEQIRVALQDAASGLKEQAIGWIELATRVTALEQAAKSPRPEERPELSHDVGQEETGAMALAELKQELQNLSSKVKRLGQCFQASWATSLNGSLQDLQNTLSTTEHDLEEHQRLFHSLFGNIQGLVASNVSLDLGKLQAMLNRKGKKLQKGEKARVKKLVEPLVERRAKGLEQGAMEAEPLEAASPVAFYASFSEGTAALQTVRFNTTSINIGGSYFPEHGYFQAPKRGVYLFAVSIEFGPGLGTGQLVFGGHHRTPVYSTDQKDGSTATTFAMAELQKGERVWFELTQGSVTKRSLPGTAFGGFLLFET